MYPFDKQQNKIVYSVSAYEYIRQLANIGLIEQTMEHNYGGRPHQALGHTILSPKVYFLYKNIDGFYIL